ncbi:MAG: T9SS type A sorting domain-containing protein [Bacteroidales bacterium]|nr:T9SS type A sorting domain-containing protein [Bacteroidales bacterium]
MPPDAYDLYMSLMGKSPYLSDSVLMAAIEKESVLPNVLIKDILVANPQAAKSTDVMDKVDEKSDPMTPEMVAEILLGKYLVATKEKLEAKLSYYRQQRSNALKYLKQLYRNDTIDPFVQDTLIYLLENEQGLQEKYELVFEYVKRENWPAAMTLLGNLPVMYPFDSYRQEAYDDHCQLILIYQELYQAGYGPDSLSEVQGSILEQLADNTQNIAGSYARNILIETNGHEYTEPVLLPETGPKSGNIVFDLPDPATFTPEYIKIYPNPAKDYIIIELLTGNVDGATVRVFDIQGKPVRVTEIPAEQQHYALPVEDLQKGIYYLKVELNGKTLESKKFSKIN